MFDKFDEGYQNGLADGRAGKQKNITAGLPMLAAMVSPKAVESYSKGYSIGYVQGKKEWQRERRKEIGEKIARGPK